MKTIKNKFVDGKYKINKDLKILLNDKEKNKINGGKTEIEEQITNSIWNMIAKKIKKLNE